MVGSRKTFKCNKNGNITVFSNWVFGESIFPAANLFFWTPLHALRDLNKDPTIWLDGARSLIMSLKTHNLTNLVPQKNSM